MENMLKSCVSPKRGLDSMVKRVQKVQNTGINPIRCYDYHENVTMLAVLHKSDYAIILLQCVDCKKRIRSIEDFSHNEISS